MPVMQLPRLEPKPDVSSASSVSGNGSVVASPSVLLEVCSAAYVKQVTLHSQVHIYVDRLRSFAIFRRMCIYF